MANIWQDLNAFHKADVISLNSRFRMFEFLTKTFWESFEGFKWFSEKKRKSLFWIKAEKLVITYAIFIALFYEFVFGKIVLKSNTHNSYTRNINSCTHWPPYKQSCTGAILREASVCVCTFKIYLLCAIHGICLIYIFIFYLRPFRVIYF